MKKTRLFIAMLAAVAALASCGDKPVDPKGPEGPDGSQKEVKSEECRLTAFVVTVGAETLEGFIDQTDKSVELSYLPDHLAGLKAATAVATISDKATITPDPAQPTDYTVDGGVEFTVTAEDGEHKTVYTVYAAPAEFSERVKKVWEKTYGEIGFAEKGLTTECGIGFVSLDKFAYCDLSVFDLEGNKVGTLNTTGLPDLATYGDGAIKARGQLGSMSNDVNGVLVAIATHEGTYADGSTVGCRTEVYAWKDGWDKAPTKIYGPVDYQCVYMSVAGDVTGDFILNFRTGAANPQMHHVLVYTGGKYFNEDGSPACTWYGPFIQHPGNDGVWGQQLSFFSGDPEEGFVCWDSIDPKEYPDIPASCGSSAFYVYPEGLTAFQNGAATEIPLYGTITWAQWQQVGTHFLYGNYSTGHVRAFKYNGVRYIVACSSSWPCQWVTVQKAENIVEDDEETDEIDESLANYLLTTDMIEQAASGEKVNAPCSAYVYDPSITTGHIIVASQNIKVLAYDIVTTIL